jgi:glycosyltransferase involved in cell wall biosynthesis
VAVVIQRFVEESGGGAEEHCRALVQALREGWELDVITTCARDHHTWANELPPGIEEASGYRVLRFPVARGKRRLLSALLSRTALRLPHRRGLEEFWIRSLGPDSPQLLEFLEEEAAGRYGAVIFYTYLYATTVLGLPRAGARTILIPTAHDEPALGLGLHRDLFRRAGGLCYLTPEEKTLVERVAGPLAAPHLILGAELDPRAWLPGDAGAFRKKYDLPGPFVLYLGRIERSKGLRELFSVYGRSGRGLPPLVLCGRRGPLAVPRCARLLGYLSEEDKRGALAACEALVQPSARESLSLVVLEAWAQRRPVLLNRRCAVLSGQCLRSKGGLAYQGRRELATLLPLISTAERKLGLGENGYRYARANYGQGTLKARLEPFLSGLGWLEPNSARTSRVSSRKRVDIA